MGLDRFRHARRIDADALGIYHSDMTRLLHLDKSIAGKTILSGQGATGNALDIKANTVDVRPFVRLTGNGTLYLVGNPNIDFGLGPNLTGRMLTTGGGLSFHFKESTTPTPMADWGAIYTKADNHLYFQDGAGAEHDMGSP